MADRQLSNLLHPCTLPFSLVLVALALQLGLSIGRLTHARSLFFFKSTQLQSIGFGIILEPMRVCTNAAVAGDCMKR